MKRQPRSLTEGIASHLHTKRKAGLGNVITEELPAIFDAVNAKINDDDKATVAAMREGAAHIRQFGAKRFKELLVEVSIWCVLNEVV
jgi:hypothetical protein